MKKFIVFLLFCWSFLVFAQTDSVAADYNLNSERILSFHSDIKVSENGEILITEKIKVNSLGEQIKRGIFRSLPLNRNLNGKEQRVKYNIVSVKKNGASEKYHKKNGDGFLKIYIGDKDVTLSPGEYEYEIQYSTKNQIGFFKNYDEFYWNVNGTEWDFPIDAISATVRLPARATILQNSCYTGASGSSESNCESVKLSNTSMEWSAKSLNPKENLTIAVGFPKGVFLPPPPPSFLEKYGVAILLGLVMIVLLGYGYTTWRKYGIDPPKPIVYPQFDVPENLSPAGLGYLKSEDFKDSYLTASLVSLAIKGYVQIIEEEESSFFGLSKSKIFKVKKLKEPDQALPKEEIGVMNDLFLNRDEVTFDGEYDSKVESTVSGFSANLKYQFKDILTAGNNAKFLWVPILLILCAYSIGLAISYIISDEVVYVIVGLFMLVFMFVIFAVIAYVLNKVKVKGCFTIFIGLFLLSFLVQFLAMGFSSSVDANFRYCYQFLFVSMLFLATYEYLIKRPSEEKLRVQSLIDGFKMYMGAAENEQLKFHNSPKMTPEVFEKYLPYAMVLGVDDIWGKKFEAALAAMAVGYANSWYIGSSLHMGSFSSSLNSSLTNSISSGSTAPSSSSSGSGSGGGGFSGGGGGGGGGGGW